MTATDPNLGTNTGQSAARDALHDHRVHPRGVLPRHLQTWIMAGLAAAMVLIILITGRPAPRPRAGDTATPQASTSLPPDRLRRYQEQLAEQEARLRQELADTQTASTAASQAGAPAREPQPADPILDEEHRRAYTSLFAENVAFTRRAAGTAPTAPPRQTAERAGGDLLTPEALARAIAASMPAAAPPAAPTSPVSAAAPSPPPAVSGPRPIANGQKRLLEGTVIEGVLTNRLDGSFTGPLNALVTTPVYAQDRQSVVVPSGARVLGTAAPVQAFGESRLAVRFHRLVMPNGMTYSLDQFTGLNERGDAGLKDLVDRHYLQLFGASIAIGTLSGLAQYATRSGASGTYSFSDAYGQGVGGSLAASGGRILDRFLNVLPTVTIQEGHRIKIYLTSDLDLPPYRDQ